jgi:hypothetical protein
MEAFLDRAFDIYLQANEIHMPTSATAVTKGLSAFFDYKPPSGDEPGGAGTEEFHFHYGVRKLSPKIAVCNTIVKEANIRLSLVGKQRRTKSVSILCP